jgi:hypothetical protein
MKEESSSDKSTFMKIPYPIMLLTSTFVRVLSKVLGLYDL